MCHIGYCHCIYDHTGKSFSLVSVHSLHPGIKRTQLWYFVRCRFNKKIRPPTSCLWFCGPFERRNTSVGQNCAWDSSAWVLFGFPRPRPVYTRCVQSNSSTHFFTTAKSSLMLMYRLVHLLQFLVVRCEPPIAVVFFL